jgi:hypothetical protein
VPPEIPTGGAANVLVREFKDDIREIKRDQKIDFRIVIGMFATGFVIIAGMLVFGYFRVDDRVIKLEDRVNGLNTTLVRIETKLEDLLARMPPAQTAPPHRP